MKKLIIIALLLISCANNPIPDIDVPELDPFWNSFESSGLLNYYKE